MTRFEEDARRSGVFHEAPLGCSLLSRVGCKEPLELGRAAIKRNTRYLAQGMICVYNLGMRETFDIDKHIRELKTDGLTYLPGAYTAKDCESYIGKSKALAEQYAREGIIDLDRDSYNLLNNFRRDHDMLPLICHPHADSILKTFLNDDYVLINSNLINRFRRSASVSTEVKHAGHWHSDSRYLGGKRLSNGFSFVGIVMLESFGSDNGATHYVPGSHDNAHTGFPERYGTYEHKYIQGDAGTIALFDSALWHRGGLASDKRSRWSVFNTYGPSFMKPYFWFPTMLGEEFGKTLDPTLRRLFHFDSMMLVDETRGFRH